MWIPFALALASLQTPSAPRAEARIARPPSSGAATLFVAAADAQPGERGAADFACDGDGDEVQLQAALDALAGSGGSVGLSSGTFHLDGSVQLRGRVQLVGRGKGTILAATSAFQGGGGLLDGAYSGTGVPLELVTVSDLTLDGGKWRGANAAGVHLDIDSKLGFLFGSPDAHVVLRDLLIANAAADGVWLEGAHNRAARVTRIRVWNVDGVGFRVDSPDGSYVDCDTGSSGADGFHVTSANNHFSLCKAWYADGSGWLVEGVRNTFATCAAQDNERHGFELRAGLVTLSACHADSNSYLGSGRPDGHQGLYDGFHIAANHVTLSACFAYDKNEGGRGRNQRYGTFVSGNRSRLNLQVANGNSPGGTHTHFTGGIGGTLDGTGNRIVATGEDEYVTE